MSFVLQASNINFLRYAVIKNFTDADIQQMLDENQLVLNSKKIGEVHSWKNSETGNGGEITIIKQYQAKGAECRRVKFKNQSRQQSGISYFNFCLIEQNWKIVN